MDIDTYTRIFTQVIVGLLVVYSGIRIYRSRTKREAVAVEVSFALLVISLTQVGFYTCADCPQQGWGLLLLGWMELLSLKMNWLANPALLIAYKYMLRKKYGYAAIASVASVILAASFLTRKTITMDTTMTITGYGIGYWLWLASVLIMALSSLYLIYVSKREASISILDSSEK